MKQSLQLKMGQQLTMTPQLQQAIRLLQLSTLDLQAEIQEALESNPMLETSEPDSQTENTDTDNDGDSGKNEAETAQATTSQETANDTTELDSEWQNEIPQDLPVDTQWDDIYQGSSSSAPVGPERDDSYFDSQMDNSETLQDHLLW
jgi:RNA polymerase sigma-54 factor